MLNIHRINIPTFLIASLKIKLRKSPSVRMAIGLSASVCSTATLGFPTIGKNRELKRVLEDFWHGKISELELQEKCSQIEEWIWKIQADAGMNRIAIGEFNIYNQILQYTEALNFIPPRFSCINRGVQRLFAMAQGTEGSSALDLTKLFDTNFHYSVPELDSNSEPVPDFSFLFNSLQRGMKQIGSYRTAATILGPITYLHLSKVTNLSTFTLLLFKLIPIYQNLLHDVASLNVAEIQMHEPALILDEYNSMFKLAYPELFIKTLDKVEINMVSYFEAIGFENYKWLISLQQVNIISMDFTRGDSISLIKKYGFPKNKTLGAGVIDARSVWCLNPEIAVPILEDIISMTGGSTKLQIQPSCSFQFIPIDISSEVKIFEQNPIIAQTLAFSVQKLTELKVLARVVDHLLAKTDPSKDLYVCRTAWEDYRLMMKSVQKSNSEEVKKQIDSFGVRAFQRESKFEERVKMQTKNMPKLPTTTVGSFPQTAAVRALRQQYKKGLITDEEYNYKIDLQIAYAIGVQEALGLDILVHGEFERADMVEFFGQNLEGFMITENGWVQSYGSRCVRPPIIYSDISRVHPIALREFKVAQSLTKKPVKGMLTGPITILNWSFPRVHVDKKMQAFQLAVALREEIKDLETAGCTIIQVDEPALREGVPMNVEKKQAYLQYAVESFLFATSGVSNNTQIHTHMCYSEFQDCIDAINCMDADVFYIENSRSGDATLEAFVAAGYSRILGPGTFDIHSPIIPSQNEIVSKLQKFCKLFPMERLICCPDCGLKTRTWDQTIKSLKIMVEAASIVRNEYCKNK